MSDDYYDYDPGTPYEPPPRRRRRKPDYKRESEYDDAWAAADEAEDDFGNVEVEGLAAGYNWQDRDRYGIERDDDDRPYIYGDDLPARPPSRSPSAHPNVRRQDPADLGPLPGSVDRVRDRRPHEPRHTHAHPDRREYPPHERAPRAYDPRSRGPRAPQPRTPVPPSRRAPTYHRDRARRGEYGEYYGPRERTPVPQPPPRAHRQPDGRPAPGYGSGGFRGIPYWQILIIVLMSVLALLSVAFACASVLTL